MRLIQQLAGDVKVAHDLSFAVDGAPPLTVGDIRAALASYAPEMPISTGDGLLFALSLVERQGRREILLSRAP